MLLVIEVGNTNTGVGVYDGHRLLVSWRLAKFFAHESCGKCTPCREGAGWIERVTYRMANGLGRPEDLDLLLDFGSNIVPGLNAPFAQTTISSPGLKRLQIAASMPPASDFPD